MNKSEFEKLSLKKGDHLWIELPGKSVNVIFEEIVNDFMHYSNKSTGADEKSHLESVDSIRKV